MKLEQLRLVVEIERHDFNLSRAATSLNAPQPALSRQLKALEHELGIDIFIRGANRLRGLTKPGKEIIAFARQVLDASANIKKVACDFREADRGRITIATTHTQARYALPRVVRKFAKRYPQVQFTIRQGRPPEIVDLVRRGEADIYIGSESGEGGDLLLLPCHPMDRVVITPPDHPLLRVGRLTLDTLARFPILTYDAPALGHAQLVQSFASHGLAPNIILSSIDTDVIKAYVEEGLGIAIVAKLAFDPARDRNLRALDASHLFESSIIQVGLRPDDYLRNYVLDFIEIFAPHLTRARIKSQIRLATRRR